MAADKKNFFLWGQWGGTAIDRPLLTEKLRGDVRKVVIGDSIPPSGAASTGRLRHGAAAAGMGHAGAGAFESGVPGPQGGSPSPLSLAQGSGSGSAAGSSAPFVLAIRQSDGGLFAWGEDRQGCLGLGAECLSSADPLRVEIPPASAFFDASDARIKLWFSHFTPNAKHTRGARALANFALARREVAWRHIAWRGKHAQTPVVVANKLHYFCDVDVLETVRRVLRIHWSPYDRVGVVNADP